MADSSDNRSVKMAFSRRIISTIAIQALGPASYLFAIWYIGKFLGVEAQGKFSTVKSLIDLLLSILIFGFPQSFVYGINRLHLSRGILIRWTLKYGVCCLGLGAVLILFLRLLAWGPLELLQGHYIKIALLIVSMSGLVISNLLRGVLLTITDNWSFSLMSILPSVSIAIFIIFLIIIDCYDYLTVFGLAGFVSAVTGLWFVRKSFNDLSGCNNPPWRDLIVNGGTVFLQGLLVAAQPFLTLALIRNYGGDYREIAYFSVAMYVYQAAIIPLTMVNPILFNRWCKNTEKSLLLRDARRLLFPVLPLAVVIGMGWFVIPEVIKIAFGNAYIGAVPVIQLISLAIPVLYVSNVGLPIIMALGQFKTNVLLVGVKLVVCIITLLIFLPNASFHAQKAASAWLVAEISLCLLISVTVWKMLRPSSG